MENEDEYFKRIAERIARTAQTIEEDKERGVQEAKIRLQRTREAEERAKRGEEEAKILAEWKKRMDDSELRKKVRAIEGAKGIAAALVTSMDYPIIFNRALTCKDSMTTWSYILREVYEKSQKGTLQPNAGYLAHTNDLIFRSELRGYGLGEIICPFLEFNEEEVFTRCRAGERSVLTTCRGMHYEGCTQLAKGIFELATKEISIRDRMILPKNPIKVPKMFVEAVDPHDLDDWWKQDGKYE